MGSNRYLGIFKKVLFALVLTGVCAFIRFWLFSSLGEQHPYSTFYLAVMLSALYGGVYLGIFSTVCSVLLAHLWLLSSNPLSQEYTLGFFIFLFNGLIFSFVGEAFRRKQHRLMSMLKESHRLRTALDGISAFVYMKDKNRRYVYANKTTLDLFQCSLEQLYGKDDREFFPLETVRQLNKIDTQVIKYKKPNAEEVVVDLQDGSKRYYWEVKTPIFDPEDRNKIWGLCGISTDVTEQKKYEEAIRDSEERFHSIFDFAAIGIALINLEGYFLVVNNSLCCMLGYSAQELMQKRFQDITHPEDLESDLHLMKQLLNGSRSNYRIEKRYFHKDGRIIWIVLTGSIVSNIQQNRRYFIAQIIDITEQKYLHLKLEDQAHRDYLTGLYNRRFFIELAETTIKKAKKEPGSLFLLMIDIDHFKKINDKYGHKVGDKILQSFSKLLRKCIGFQDISARIGGEEFVILLPNSSPEKALKIADKIRSQINKKSLIHNKIPITYTISIGIASWSIENKNIDLLLDAADKALYKAKSQGRDCIILG